MSGDEFSRSGCTPAGEADLAIYQISEILPAPGVTLVGPLPEAIQNFTTYAGAVSSDASDPQAERDIGEGAVDEERGRGPHVGKKAL